MEFKGTKGKWQIEFLCDENSIRASLNKGSIDVWADMNGETIEEANANALLISRAPEMLEALKMFVEAVYTEEIIIKENYDNDGHENCGGRLYQKFKQLIKEATEL